MIDARFAGRERHLDVMRANRRPAVGVRVGARAALDHQRRFPAAIRAQEVLALGVVARQRLGAGEVGEVIAALAVLRLVVDYAILDFDLADVQIALVVGRVVVGVPQAELDQREDRQVGGLIALVGECELPDFQIFAQRHEVARAGANALIGRADDGVAESVLAGVAVEIAAGRLPRRRPVGAAAVVAQVDVAPARIERDVVVAVARQAAQARVHVEGVAACRIRDDAEIGFAAQVVQPGDGRVRAGDDVLTPGVVKGTVAHVLSP